MRFKCTYCNLIFTALTYLFLYTPIIVLLVFSFNTLGFPSPWQKFTWKWYEELFHTPMLWRAFFNSLIIAISSTFISVTLGVLLIFQAAEEGKLARILSLFYGNLLIPETVLAVSLLGFFTLLDIPLGIGTLIIAHSILGLGFVIPIVYARYVEFDPRLKEASLDLGATALQTFFRVILPYLRPAILASSILVFIISFDDFILSFFCSGSSSQTLSLYIYSMIKTGISPIVNALSAILLMLSSAFVLIFLSLRSRNVRILG